MGRGNYLPIDGRYKEYRMVYIDKSYEYDQAVEQVKERWIEDGDVEDPEDFYEDDPDVQSEVNSLLADWSMWEFEDLLVNLRGALPASFSEVDRYEHGGYGHDEHVLGENQLFELRLAEEDNYYAIIFTVQTGDYFTYTNLANSQVERVSRAYFKRLQKSGYDLSQRSGAWMSSRVDYTV